MILFRRCWYPAFVIYRWRYVMGALPLLALLGLLALHWNRLRVDQVVGTYSPRIATSLFPGSEHSKLAQLFDLARSPEVLGKAARDCGLDGASGMTDTQAADRFRSRVICDIAPESGLFELKVRKLREGDALVFCQAIEANLRQELRVAFDAEAAISKAERIGILQKAVTDLEAKVEAGRAEFLANRPTVENPGDSVSRFEALTKIQADRRLLDQFKLEMVSERCGCGSGPLEVAQAPHWPGRPSDYDLKRFGIASAWTFGVSVLTALVLAYLLEAFIPRKVVKQGIPFELQFANERS